MSKPIFVNTDGMQATLGEMLDAAGGKWPIDYIVKGDPGFSAAITSISVGRLMRQADPPTLNDYGQLDERARQIAEKLVKGQAFLTSVQSKLDAGLTPQVKGEDYTHDRLLKDRARLDAWNRELDGVEELCEDAWREYLRAQEGGQRTVETKDGTGRRIILSVRPILNSRHPVWTPKEIVVALRIRATLKAAGAEEAPSWFGYDEAAQFLLENCQIDPVEKARKATGHRKLSVVERTDGELFGSKLPADWVAKKNGEKGGFGTL